MMRLSREAKFLAKRKVLAEDQIKIALLDFTNHTGLPIESVNIASELIETSGKFNGQSFKVTLEVRL